MSQQEPIIKKGHFENVRVLIAESDQKLRFKIEQSLLELGFKTITSTSKAAEVEKAFITQQVDLLICDAGVKDKSVVNVVRAMRLGLLGGNIYPLVVTLISTPTQDLVRRVIDSGADTILVKPLNFEHLQKRIVEFADKRERFVVTSEYIGPDRRLSYRPGTPGAIEIPKTEVPNPLRNKVKRFYNDADFQNFVKRTTEVINDLRIERQSYHIGYLVDKIQPSEKDVEKRTDMPKEWNSLVFAARDLATRIKGSRFTHVDGMTVTLVNFVDDMSGAGILEQQDLRLLSQLSKGISRGCSLN